MLRTLLYLLLSILALTLIRGVIGIVMKAAAGWLGSGQKRESVESRPSTEVPSSGMLRRDPVCGTYVAESISVKLNSPAGPIHFCSAACRDQYVKAGAAS